MERFDRAAPRYEAWYATPRGARAARAERAVLERLLADRPAAKRLLEVGCGTGYFTEWLQHRFGWTVGLDPSAAMLAALRAADRTAPVVRGDAEALPFARGAFDVVLFITTLEFADDPSVALREAVRTARSAVVVLSLNPWSLGAVRRSLAPHGLSSQARRLTLPRLRRLLRRAGGSRSQRIAWKSTLLPAPFSLVQTRVPLGDVLAMRLGLGPAP